MTEVSSSATVDLEQAIRVERDGPIATVLFDRAAKLNAFTEAMWRRLGETVDALSADDDVRCVVLRGDGDRAFSVGADIGEFKETRHLRPVALARPAAVFNRTEIHEGDQIGLRFHYLANRTTSQ